VAYLSRTGRCASPRSIAKNGTTWELLHRHADALVHRITLEQLSDLARGTPRTDQQRG
jgi:hypothetical protein